MNETSLLPLDRFRKTLDVVYREGRHLLYSWNRLYSHSIDVHWVEGLEKDPDRAVELEAFVSRFGRMQDTIADKLLPRWLMALAEVPGSQIETLNRAERLGVLSSTEQWLEARKLRNLLIHEYMEDPRIFAEALKRAQEYALLLISTYNRVRDYAAQRMEMDGSELPPVLALPQVVSGQK